MGSNITSRLSSKGHRVVVYDSEKEAIESAVQKGALAASSLVDLAGKLARPRAVWLMVPSGDATETVINSLTAELDSGDIIIDGGNSFYLDSIRREKKLSKKGVNFLDVGVSGGPSGARYGACLMIGGKERLFRKLKNLFKDLSTKNGFQFFEGAGAGHFVKMVHNGIEYGMMQSIAEGFNLLKKSHYKINLQKLARVYNHGSVIESRLMGWLEKAFKIHGQNLKIVSGRVGYTGEGEWTVKTAKKFGIPLEIIGKSLRFRVFSQKKPSYTGKILSALREQFGGHTAVK